MPILGVLMASAAPVEEAVADEPREEVEPVLLPVWLVAEARDEAELVIDEM